MKIEVRTRGIVLTEELASVVEKRLWFAMGRFGDRVSRTSVRVADVNGPRGGNDKRCLVEVVGSGFRVPAVEARGADVFAVVDRAIRAAARAVVRAYERARMTAQQGSPA